MGSLPAFQSHHSRQGVAKVTLIHGVVHLMCSNLAPLDTSLGPELPAGSSSHRHTIIWAHSHFSCQRLFAHGASGALWVDG